MSQAFVKEGDASDDPPERPVSDRPNYVTPRGMADLKSKAEELARRRDALAGRQDEPAQAERKILDRDLRWLQARLDGAIVVDRSGDPPPEVRFGATVELREDGAEAPSGLPSGSPSKLTIVGEDEADPSQGKISWCSPLAIALMGAKAGEEVVLEGEGPRRVFSVVTVTYQKW